ncbi:copper chaperone PCu(A)C [Fulvimarina endophytica]|uniref:Copper chaperone PCu(A)C n=1 Tax=Fulvimarina endophytica TaxID=2293836 RepID=A0A371X487_9HYPH|nr:copper chaperone PCu(A)C [Fulvimarina endophytica]RFC64041.1 copper chaperone PCu(A)C [Fulvimarina endophytica]
MKNLLAATLVAGALALPASALPAFAHHPGEGAVTSVGEAVSVSHAYTFANAGTAHSMRVYLTIENRGDSAVELTGASADFAETVLFEAQTLDGGTLRTATAETLSIGAGQTLTLQPGAVWIELESVKKAFAAGDHFHLDLTFASLGTVEIEVEVEAPPAAGDHHDHDHDHDESGV